MKLKDEKGAITLFVLVSMLLFIATITSVYTFVQGKNRVINSNLKQIKSQYEVDDNSLSALYEATVYEWMPKITLENSGNTTITGKIELIDDAKKIYNINIKSIKYGWYISDTALDYNDLGVDKIGESNLEWYTPEIDYNNLRVDKIGESNLEVDTPEREENLYIKKNINGTGYYYLCLMVNNMEFWKYIHV